MTPASTRRLKPARFPTTLNSPSDDQETYEERILVIRFSSLGDILLTAPALRSLHTRFPESRIDLLVASDYEDAARLIPGPDRVLTFDKRSGFSGLLRLRRLLAGQYSLLVDLQNNFRSAFLRATVFPTVWVKARRYRFKRWMLIRFKRNLYREVRPVPLRYLAALDLVAVTDDGRGLELAVPEELKEWARYYLKSRCNIERPVVALCPGARHNTKMWPPECWVALGNELVRLSNSVLVIGSAQEQALIANLVRQIPSAVPVTDRSLREIAALFTQVTVAVSNDSGLMHLAGGVGAPVVAIFGPTVEEFGFYPFRMQSEVLSHQLYCRPCTAMGGKRCPEGHFRCMMETPPAAVLAAVQRLMSADQASSL
jgi:lipopolysaccharide heptosyltransferase II